MKAEFAAAIIVALISGGAWKYLPDKIGEWKNRKRIASEADRSKREERQERERDTWFRESKAAYRRVERECEKCAKELIATRKGADDTRKAFYRLLDDLEEQVIPVADDVVRAAIRGVVHRAREAL